MEEGRRANDTVSSHPTSPRRLRMSTTSTGTVLVSQFVPWEPLTQAWTTTHNGDGSNDVAGNSRANSDAWWCPRCIQLDLDIITRDCEHQGGWNLGTLSTWDTGKCQLCQFFCQCLPDTYRRNRSEGTEIVLLNEELHQLSLNGGVTVQALTRLDFEKKKGYLVLSSVAGWYERRLPSAAIIHIPKERWDAVEPTTPMIDFAMIAGWLAKLPPTLHKTDQWFMINKSIVTWLRVIDCKNRAVIALPAEETYVTLSYVWGPGAADKNKRTEGRHAARLKSALKLLTTTISRPSASNRSDARVTLPEKLPRTIEDSITVCKTLGYRYLWIDKYCIPQGDHRMRNQQIQLMHVIYSMSSLTIVACAGTDPTRGLPGVSTLREPSPSIDCGGVGYFQSIPTLRDIRSSSWASRAWTYQESMLANRLLYFTDKQVYFESERSVESELTSTTGVRLVETDDMCTRLELRSLLRLREATEVYHSIGVYSKRQMSFQEDTINALLGILVLYERLYSIWHLWGLPFSTNAPCSIDLRPCKHILTFEESLRWYTHDPPERRKKFPSWSWAGWRADVQWGGFRTAIDLENTPVTTGAMSVNVELESGATLTWYEYQARYETLDYGNHWKWSSDGVDQPSHFIHVEGFASEITSIHIDEQNVPKFSIATPTGESLEIEGLGDRASDWVEAVAPISTGSLLALHLVNIEPTEWETKDEWFRAYYQSAGCALLVRNMGEHWERVLLLRDPKSQIHNAKNFKTKIRLG